jgi:hypothetical protein
MTKETAGGHVASMGEKRNAYKIFVENPVAEGAL